MGEGEIIAGVLSGGERLDKAVAAASGLTRERVKALIADGRVWLNGKALAQPSAKAAEAITGARASRCSRASRTSGWTSATAAMSTGPRNCSAIGASGCSSVA